MDHFQRAGKGQDALRASAYGLPAGKGQDGPNPFPPGKQAIVHGLPQVLGRGLMVGQQLLERPVNQRAALL